MFNQVLSLDGVGDYRLPQFAISANSTLGISLFDSIGWGNLTCGDGTGSLFFNDSTKFFNHCFIVNLIFTYSLILLLPSLYRIKDLLRLENGPKTSFGQLNNVLALLCPVLWILNAWFADYDLRLPELGSIAIGLIIAWLHYLQDGVVAVCSPELLLYWLVISGGYVIYAIDAVLLRGWKQSFPNTVAAVFAVAIFILELTNNERTRDDSYENNSLFEKTMISFGNKTLERGQSKDISLEDIPPPPIGVDALSSYYELEEKLSSRSLDSKYRLLLALKDLVGLDVLIMCFLSLFDFFTTLLQPQIMLLFLRSLSNKTHQGESLYKSYYIATLFGLVPVIIKSLENLQELRAGYARSKCRAGLLGLIYRKALSLSPKARETYDTSKITNLISIDANEVFSLITGIPTLFSLPFALAFSLWQLWNLLGLSFLAAGFVYLILTPVQSLISVQIGKIYPDIMMKKDKRNKVTTNVLRCIKSLKLQAWEAPYFRLICEARNDELNYLRKVSYIMVVFFSTFFASSTLVSAVIFTFYLFIKKGALTPDIAFPALTLLQLASFFMMMVPMYVVQLQQSLTSQTRVNDLLLQESKKSHNYSRYGAETYDDTPVIVDNAKLSWNGDLEEAKIAIDSISFEAGRGELICIIGRVGSGKTAILQALCGDLCILEGTISLKGSVAICTQEAWLQNSTVRENILFGEHYDEQWYKRVLTACELDKDVSVLDKGDETNIGERGISLSGGQKARVALARAVYSRADVFLLDDVLSAVDEHVSAALIKQIFSSQGLLGNRTVILATNNMRVLSHSSRIIALKDKRVAEISSFQEVLKKRKDSLIFKLIEDFGRVEDLENDEFIEDRKSLVLNYEKTDAQLYAPLLKDIPQQMNNVDIRIATKDEEEEEKKPANLAVYWRYYFLRRTWLVWTIFGFTLVTLALGNLTTYFLGRITAHAFTSLYDARFYILSYFLLILVEIVNTVAMLGVTDIAVGLGNAKLLHEQMLWSVMRAPMSFFDKTPIGKLINRFTSDVSAIDNRFANTFGEVMRSFISLILSLLGIVIGSPHVLLIVGPVAWFANNIRKLYVPTRRKVLRIYNAANSPILSHVEDSLKGRLVITAFDRTSRFINTFDDRVNNRVKASFFLNVLGNWLETRIAFITATLMSVSALGLVQFVGLGIISTSYSGVVLSFAETVGSYVGGLIKKIVSAETSAISLERIFEYIDMPQEAPDVIEATKPNETWPSTGKLIFDKVSAKYSADGPTVLKDLTFNIHNGEKIGVVGRTGSGKSTLSLVIFRLLEASEGSIELDGINTSILGLSTLRSHLSIVPQDAQIFDSTVRENLDPFHTCDDARLWEILEYCHIKEHFKALDGLDTELTDSGSSLSRGQCQLLCLGRALVHESKLLVLDEATASVDHETDKIIQETIREHMSDRTIITVAHRLNTIMDSDRVIVLDQGEIKEFDTPERLLELKGYFYKLHNSELKEEKEEESLI